MNTPVDSAALADRVISRIKGEGIRPRPRWEFFVKNVAFWALGAFAVALGALAFSAGLFEVENAGWRFYAATHGSLFMFALEAMPFLWLLALALFILLGYANIRRTKRGYRYPLALIAFGAVLTSVALGTGLYAAGFGAELEEALGDHPPFYRPILVEQRAWWDAPGKGLLGGSVVSMATDTATFVLKDFSGKTWTVSSAGLPRDNVAFIARGGVVRVVGVPGMASSSRFDACFVFPWKTYGMKAAPPPLPLAIISSSSETSTVVARIEECKSIGSYRQLRSIEEEGF
jgi:hypothetical protein